MGCPSLSTHFEKTVGANGVAVNASFCSGGAVRVRGCRGPRRGRAWDNGAGAGGWVGMEAAAVAAYRYKRTRCLMYFKGSGIDEPYVVCVCIDRRIGITSRTSAAVTDPTTRKYPSAAPSLSMRRRSSRSTIFDIS